MLKHSLMVLLGLSLTFSLPNSWAFNVNAAVLVEAQLRAAARFCTDENFSNSFLAQSKEQVAFSLMGEDRYEIQQVERVITAVDSKLTKEDLTAIDCTNAYSALHELYDIRKKSLRDGKDIAKELQKIN